ncbi:MAG: hypothetical protein GDA66_05240 [Nitrospira sp. CR1.2]|nr:hypothetical protein [Nitrospira sp. CR1.2]
MNVTNLGLSWNSRYLELEPTELAIAIVAALLVGGAALYVLLKVLRSKPVKLLGIGLLLGAVALVGWLAVDRHQQDERTRVSEIWSRTFENNDIKDFESCVAHRIPRSPGAQYRVEVVTECGDVAKAIKEGLEAR